MIHHREICLHKLPWHDPTLRQMLMCTYLTGRHHANWVTSSLWRVYKISWCRLFMTNMWSTLRITLPLSMLNIVMLLGQHRVGHADLLRSVKGKTRAHWVFEETWLLLCLVCWDFISFDLQCKYHCLRRCTSQACGIVIAQLSCISIGAPPVESLVLNTWWTANSMRQR